jgi:hypothetical protein
MPVCFMIMPYGRKPTQAEAGRGPAVIDFNALWDNGYVPVIKGLGYEPVRADQDTGGLIISQMLERLYFADLVLADMTIPNGNVYYEVGIRQPAHGPPDDRDPRTKWPHSASTRSRPKHRNPRGSRRHPHPRLARNQPVMITVPRYSHDCVQELFA